MNYKRILSSVLLLSTSFLLAFSIESRLTETSISVKKARSSQKDLISNGEHCSMDTVLLNQLEISLGQQVRIIRDDSNYAIYTVSELVDESSDNIVRLGKKGRERLGTTDVFTAKISIEVVKNLSKEDAIDQNEFIERLTDNGIHNSLIAIGPHGGFIERYTDEQAQAVADELIAHEISSWTCLGYKDGGGAYDRWHITSTDINEASFPRLNTVIDRDFDYAVAFHGWEKDHILIGGNGSSAIKQRLKDALVDVLPDDIEVKIAESDDPFGGFSTDNIVNRLGNQSFQLEQSLAARKDYGEDIALAVAGVFRDEL